MNLSDDPDRFLDARIGVDFARLSVDAAVVGRRGETIGLVGANGAGKTTVLRAIAGLQPLHRGEITINSRCLDDPSAGVFVETQHRRVAMVFQDYRLFPNLTVLENVAFGLRRRSVSRSDAVQLAREWLARVDMADHHSHRPATLSGGQAQRVALARSLATDPDVLLLDEPLAAIDPGSRARILNDLARHLSGFAGVAVIVSHNHEDIRRLADRALVLESGRVVWDGTGSDCPDGPGSPSSQ